MKVTLIRLRQEPLDIEREPSITEEQLTMGAGGDRHITIKVIMVGYMTSTPWALIVVS